MRWKIKYLIKNGWRLYYSHTWHYSAHRRNTPDDNDEVQLRWCLPWSVLHNHDKNLKKIYKTFQHNIHPSLHLLLTIDYSLNIEGFPFCHSTSSFFPSNALSSLSVRLSSLDSRSSTSFLAALNFSILLIRLERFFTASFWNVRSRCW